MMKKQKVDCDFVRVASILPTNTTTTNIRRVAWLADAIVIYGWMDGLRNKDLKDACR